MRWLLAALLAPALALSLAGCADMWNVDRPVQIVTPTTHMSSLAKPAPHKREAAMTEHRTADAKDDTRHASLMECVSDACRKECAPDVAKQSRPKWCLYFREPVDRSALRETPGGQHKSTE